jgi:hypothetical protein
MVAVLLRIKTGNARAHIPLASILSPKRRAERRLSLSLAV